jgi:4-alpha-glucanotransferase
MQFDRSSGILLHPTSLPASHGIGDLGDSVHGFIDWLHLAHQRLWQILPLGPVGYGNSPYASLSAYAGNTLLISLDRLAREGSLDPADLENAPQFADHEVTYPNVVPFKEEMLWRAFHHSSRRQIDAALDDFIEREQDWLLDYARFMSLKASFQGDHWLRWPERFRMRHPDALSDFDRDQAESIRFHCFAQFIFRQQWEDVRRHAWDRNIQIVGDIPIYVAADSADVWANQHLFRLEESGAPAAVSGVPPDLFTEHGQLWGNPVYDWKRMAQDDYSWWRRRIAATLDIVDIIRIDHFRGFAAGWVVPAKDPTARTGWWERGPGTALFGAIEREMGDLPIVVEDLGLITPDVDDLRKELGFPGMKVLQFAFGGDPRSQYLPHMYDRNTVVYPGTHDNQTTIGWFQSIPDDERRRVQTYVGTDGSDIAWDFIHLAHSSVADMSIVTLQDVMRLGDEARMNIPGVAEGNWRWRYLEHQLHDGLAGGLAELTQAYGRARYEVSSSEPDPFDYSAPGTGNPLYEPGSGPQSDTEAKV